jgi:hypothetical protein
MSPLHSPFRLRNKSRFIYLCLALSALMVATVTFAQTVTPAGGAATDIWLGGEDPVVQKDKHKNQPADYMDMFNPGAPWSVAASGLTAFKISTQLALRGTDEQVRAVIDGLKSRHIALAIELGVLTGSSRCGKGTEGYASPATVDAVVKRIKRLGGQLDYVAMDEPITWGHEKTGTNAQGFSYCHDDVVDLVDQVAPKIAMLQRAFPNVQIGEIDAINGRYPHLSNDIIEFIDTLHKKTGLRPAFVHADIAWDSQWQPMLEDLTRRLRARGVRVGVVFDGDLDAVSDRAWVAQALERERLITGNPSTRPDDLVFQTWSPRPTHMLPETDPGAWTYAVRDAVAAKRHGSSAQEVTK